MPDGHVRVGLFPTLSETIVCQLGTVAELPRTATKSWKSGKKTAFRAAKAAAAASKESPAASKESPAASSSKDSARKKRKVANSPELEPPAASSSSEDSAGRQPSEKGTAAKAAAAASKESPAASSSKEPARKKRKAAQKSHKLSFDGYIDLLAAKIEEGNKTKGNKDQRRGADGKFGNKNLLDCSWRTWLKSMFTEYPGVLCKCSCNHRPLTSAQALIKHIERNHYINNVVSFGEEDLEFTPPQF
ncbi:histone H1.10-like isoform X2 [Magallana gigas]|uniref:histone H1.10-like isoform X1 n=1 Tax=Magallana gigas TaxID=29159 RepID=UPI00148A9DB4|nr:myristoylated alanine-rich C-kinase substrate-like isoform X3 [Crassostrea gigas]XP_034315413.1 myristoylated alanine-rich C-kinase substrate-like isoform X1 [Crassostrea gigas]